MSECHRDMDTSPDSPISDGAESVQSDGPGSTVPTEPLNASERRLVDNYMSHRQQFMSDFERYNVSFSTNIFL
jgi:hypothetical protein